MPSPPVLNPPSNEWTFNTLLAHVRSLIDGVEQRSIQRWEAQQLAVKAALIAHEKATALAEVNAEKWRDSANEWRGAMNDRERSLMPRLEAEQRLKALEEKIIALDGAVEKASGRREGLMLVFAVIAALATLLTVYMAVRK